jgi:protein required for attachment to host cells
MRFCYLVADGAQARLFKTDKLDGPLRQTKLVTNEQGRLNNRDFDTDRPGRAFTGGSQRSSMEKGEPPRERAEIKFAKKLAEQLNNDFRNGDFQRLGIVAAPKALGRIKEHLDDAVLDTLIGSSSRNLTKQNIEDIQQHISEHLL